VDKADAVSEVTHHTSKLRCDLPSSDFNVCILCLEKCPHFIVVLLRIEIIDKLFIE
jgi:hypothetical protein